MKTFIKNLRAVARFKMAALRTHRAELPAAARIAVVAPHPDDETFGCGGIISLSARDHIPMQVVFLSDGEASLKRWRVPPLEVSRQRRSQTIHAATAFGIAEPHLDFLHVPDGRIPSPGQQGYNDIAQRLTDLLSQFAPDVIYCVHPSDGWADHAASAALVQTASSSLHPKPRLLFYTVWMWFSAPWGMPGALWNRGLSIDVHRVLAAKRIAINAYLRDAPSPAGIPWCGLLPWSLKYVARQPTEIVFEV